MCTSSVIRDNVRLWDMVRRYSHSTAWPDHQCIGKRVGPIETRRALLNQGNEVL